MAVSANGTAMAAVISIMPAMVPIPKTTRGKPARHLDSESIGAEKDVADARHEGRHGRAVPHVFRIVK